MREDQVGVSEEEEIGLLVVAFSVIDLSLQLES